MLELHHQLQATRLITFALTRSRPTGGMRSRPNRKKPNLDPTSKEEGGDSKRVGQTKRRCGLVYWGWSDIAFHPCDAFSQTNQTNGARKNKTKRKKRNSLLIGCPLSCVPGGLLWNGVCLVHLTTSNTKRKAKGRERETGRGRKRGPASGGKTHMTIMCPKSTKLLYLVYCCVEGIPKGKFHLLLIACTYLRKALERIFNCVCRPCSQAPGPPGGDR